MTGGSYNGRSFVKKVLSKIQSKRAYPSDVVLCLKEHAALVSNNSADCSGLTISMKLRGRLSSGIKMERLILHWLRINNLMM